MGEAKVREATEKEMALVVTQIAEEVKEMFPGFRTLVTVIVGREMGAGVMTDVRFFGQMNRNDLIKLLQAMNDRPQKMGNA